jgi:hypothetical protein
MAEAQAWVDSFVRWYNKKHRHSALNWVTPMDRHTGPEHVLLRRREETYRKACQQHPNRWSRGIRDCSPAPCSNTQPSKKGSTGSSSGLTNVRPRGYQRHDNYPETCRNPNRNR